MYTGHFGLDDGPFHGKAEGQEVYIGPQQAAVIARLRKVLGVADTAVTVSGPVGVGKTTLVRRALADLPGRKAVIPVDRMRLEPDEVLDLLLSRFDVSRPPKGTIQRFAAFRRLLHERLADDIRVFIVVEDAERVGVDALLELEALTATDSGEPVGANIVLLGGEGLSGLLAKPALARLRQRVRLRQTVAPFDEAEVEGYMRHCLESAGGVLEQIFESGTTRVAYRYSGGIARVVDTLCESALAAAAEAGLATILPEFLQEVAENCGLEQQVTEADAAEPSAPKVGSAVDAAEHALEFESSTPPAPPVAPPRLALVEPSRAIDLTGSEGGGDLPEPFAPLPEVNRESELSSPVPGEASDEAPEDAGETELAMQPADESTHGASVTASRIDKVLPELIERLQSQARAGVQTAAETMQELDRSPGDSAEIPTLSSSMRVAVLPFSPLEAQPHTADDEGANDRVGEDADEGAGQDTDECADDSANEFHHASADEETAEAAILSFDEALTLAPDAATDVLAPDAPDQDTGAGEPELDALQAAIQAVNAWQASEADDDGEPAPQAPRQASEADLPEITLDAELEKRKPASDDRDRWADELSRAKTLEDMSDILAETIFGSEAVEAISAEFRAGKAAGPGEGNARPTAASDPAPPARQSGAPRVPPPRPSVARQSTAVGARPQPKAPVRPPARAPARPMSGNAINMTMSQRIEMVNSLKGRRPVRPAPGMRVAEVILGERPGESPSSAANGPQPIEAQIETAITQSRKVLSEADLARLASPGDDQDRNDGGDDDKGRRGLFGLFRRSSKT